jgi:hypothetical protein
MPANCLMLAELMSDHLQQKDKASEYYQKGLKLSLSEAGQASSTALVASE